MSNYELPEVLTKYEVYNGIAQIISRYTAINRLAIMDWLAYNYTKKIYVISMMAKYATLKKWNTIAAAILNNEKI